MSRILECLMEQVDEFVAHPWLYVRLTLVSLFHKNRKYRMKSWGSEREDDADAKEE